ncbi:MAG: hypothetical protein WBV82_23425 [Myxococcaceae bacterium]
MYILATRSTEPVPLEALQETIEGEGVEFVTDVPGLLCSIRSGDSRTDIRFETLDGVLGETPEFLTGSEEALEFLKTAQGFYRISLENTGVQASVAVFEALWCARALMEHVEGVLLDVTAFKVHDPSDIEEITELDFDIRDHIDLHAIAVAEGESPLWVHTHGMEKFGAQDVEIFQLNSEDLPAAEMFLQTLCTDLAFGHGPPLRIPVEAGDEAFMLMPSEEARQTLMGVPMTAFEGHEGNYLTVLSSSGRHNVAELLSPYRQHFEREPPEVSEQLRKTAQELLPAFKARFLRKGLMEPWSFRVRASFEAHPEDETVNEDLWVEVLAWESDALLGKLVDGGSHTTEWRKGAQVRVEESSINALVLTRDGRVLDPDELRAVLATERPM